MNYYYRMTAYDEFVTVLITLENRGYKWRSGNKPTELLRYFYDLEYRYIIIEDKLLMRCRTNQGLTPFQLKDDLEA